jgi:hypothetical protein
MLNRYKIHIFHNFLSDCFTLESYNSQNIEKYEVKKVGNIWTTIYIVK